MIFLGSFAIYHAYTTTTTTGTTTTTNNNNKKYNNNNNYNTNTNNRERSDSVKETRDRGAAGSSLTGVTALWSLSKTHLS